MTYALFHLYMEQRINNELTSEQLVNQQIIYEQLQILSEEQRKNMLTKTLSFLGKSRIAKAFKKDFEQLAKDFRSWLVIDGSPELYDYYEMHVRLPIW